MGGVSCSVNHGIRRPVKGPIENAVSSGHSSRTAPPIRAKLLLTLRPYAYGEDVILDDLYGNTGEDVAVEWRGRYGEDVPIMGYMIPEDMQTEMFALLGEGLWFDAEGIAKQVNNIELAQSDEINVDGVWHRLDYADGTGKREVYFYDTDLLTEDDIAVIAAWFKEDLPPDEDPAYTIRWADGGVVYSSETIRWVGGGLSYYEQL